MTHDILAGFRGPANRRRDRRVKIFGFVALAEIVVGGVLGWALAAHLHHHHRHLPWYLPVAIIGAEVALIVAEWLVLLLVHRRRHGTWMPEPPAVLGADKPVRKRVAKGFRKGRLPSDRTERALTVDLATKAMRLRRLMYVAMALVVVQVPILILDHREPIRVGSALVILGLLMIVAIYALVLRRAGRIETLAKTNPDQAGPSGREAGVRD